MNKIIEINSQKYKLIKEYKNGFDQELLLAKWTDYFDDYDYILGDFAYDKLRLKGFCNKENSKFNNINDKDKIDEYIKENCAYECRYFVLEKTLD